MSPYEIQYTVSLNGRVLIKTTNFARAVEALVDNPTAHLDTKVVD